MKRVILVSIIGFLTLSIVSCNKEVIEPNDVLDNTTETEGENEINEYDFSLSVSSSTPEELTTSIQINGEDVTQFPHHTYHLGSVMTNDTIWVSVSLGSFQQANFSAVLELSDGTSIDKHVNNQPNLWFEYIVE